MHIHNQMLYKVT